MKKIESQETNGKNNSTVLAKTGLISLLFKELSEASQEKEWEVEDWTECVKRTLMKQDKWLTNT